MVCGAYKKMQLSSLWLLQFALIWFYCICINVMITLQSLEDVGWPIKCNDDSILHCCLQCKAKGSLECLISLMKFEVFIYFFFHFWKNLKSCYSPTIVTWGIKRSWITLKLILVTLLQKAWIRFHHCHQKRRNVSAVSLLSDRVLL